MMFEVDSRTLIKLQEKAEREGVELQELLENFANDEVIIYIEKPKEKA